MRYLLLTEYFPDSEQAEITGGVESRCFNFVRELSSRHNLTVLCSCQPGQRRRSTVYGAEVIRCGPEIPYSNSGHILKRIILAISLYRTAKRIKADQIEGSSFITYLPAYWAGKKTSAKKVATWHETWIGEWIKNKGWITGVGGEIWERLALRMRWDEIITVSEFTKRRLVRNGIPEQKIKKVPNGVNIKDIENIKIRPFPEPTICVIGRLTRQKRVDQIIAALPLIKTSFPTIRLLVIGQGPERENLHHLAIKLKVEKNVKFQGYVASHQEVLALLKSSKIYVSASELEGFGITVIEAMASHLPLVLSPIPPFQEITKKQAIFFKDSKELAQKVLTLLKNPKIISEQIKKQDFLLKEYDWGEIGKIWLN